MRAGLASWALVVLSFSPASAWAQAPSATAVARSETRRSFAEYLFLGAQLGLRQRAAVYAEASTPGPSGRGELRFFLNGRGTTGPRGPLGAYLGLGVIGRTPVTATDLAGDPLLDPYDNFAVSQNLRLLSAHLEYQHHPDEGPTDLVVRAGRLANLDGRAMVLLYDGAALRYAPLSFLGVTVFGGRRASLDRGFADQREDLEAQLVAGGAVDLDLDGLRLELTHQYEDLQQSKLSVAWVPSPLLSLGLSAQALYGAAAVVEGQSDFATVLRLDADYASEGGATTGYLVLEAQLGTDPRSYGRGGRAPTLAELQSVRGLAIADARLDRLFFGAEPGHGHAELALTHWVLPFFGISGGAFGRSPWSSDDLLSLRPRVLEAWLGPELAFGLGQRLAVELRLALEDPGDSSRIFTTTGDGPRRQQSVRAYAELPLRLGDELVLALRPEGEIYAWSSRGPTSELSGQFGYTAGGLFTLGWGQNLRVTGRYGVANLPDLIADGVSLIHDAEVILEGAY